MLDEGSLREVAPQKSGGRAESRNRENTGGGLAHSKNNYTRQRKLGEKKNEQRNADIKGARPKKRGGKKK